MPKFRTLHVSFKCNPLNTIQMSTVFSFICLRPSFQKITHNILLHGSLRPFNLEKNLKLSSTYFSLALRASSLSISFSSFCCSILASLIFLRSLISCSLASRSACSVLRLSSTAASFASFSPCFLCLSSCKM